MRDFDYFAPTSLDEAISLLRSAPAGARALAGGTDLVAQMKEGVTRFAMPTRLVSLHKIAGLKGIGFDEADGLRIGSGATMAEVAASDVIRERFAAIAEGASVVGSLQTMNMATIGGNLCNAAPSADTAPGLLAHEAEAVIAGPGGRRRLALVDFFLGPGQSALAADELLAEVRIPTPRPHTGSAYRRHTPRKRMDIAVVGVAVVLTLAGERPGGSYEIERARIALGAVAPTPVRARQAEAALEGQAASAEAFARAAEVAASEVSPISDQRGSAALRRHLAGVMTERLLGEAAARAGRS